MEPYTTQGLAKLEGETIEEDHQNPVSNNDKPEHFSSDSSSTLYKLRGIVVHSGQANGGHYYSYILHTFPSGTSKWFKFDDGDVSECHIEEDEEMRNQCFGGEYTSETYDHYCRRMQKRVTKRWWNAYILFYQRVEKERSDNCSENLHKSFESMTLSTRLRQMPSHLEQIVRRKNMKCVHERNQYTPEFFAFVRNLCSVNVQNVKNSISHVHSGGTGPDSSSNIVLSQNAENLLLLSIKLMSKFLFTTGFHAKRSLHGSNTLTEWSDLVNVAFRCSSQCRIWFAQEVLYKNPTRFAEYIFESPNADVRMAFGRILTFLAKYSHDDPAALVTIVPERYLSSPTESLSDLLIRTLLTLLRKDNCDLKIRHLKEYVLNLYNYASNGPLEKQQLVKFDVPNILHKIGTELSDYPTVRGYSGDVNKLQNLISLLIRSLDVPVAALSNNNNENSTENNAENVGPENDKENLDNRNCEENRLTLTVSTGLVEIPDNDPEPNLETVPDSNPNAVAVAEPISDSDPPETSTRGSSTRLDPPAHEI